MTDLSPGVVPEEDAHIQQALDNAVDVLEGETDALASAKQRVADAVRRVTREAPLHSLAIAFLLGVLVARRR